MAFIQPCFIQKCTPSLIEKLVGLEYKIVGKTTLSLGKYGIFCNNGKIKICSTNEQPSIKDKNFIQCYDNENLFLALAALRDDKPNFQWFLWEHNDSEYHPEENNSWKQYIPGEHWQEWWWFEVRKATVEELIEHFKK